MDFPKRGEIWLAALDLVVGFEIAKTRPALVISNDENNEMAQTVTILPITSAVQRLYPYEAFLSRGDGNLQKDSKVKSNQIRTVDKRRLLKRFGKIPVEKIGDVERSVLIHLGFI